MRGKLKNKRKKVVEKLIENKIEVRPTMTGNFIKNPVVKFLDHSVHGKLKNSNIIDKSGFFVGNYSKNLFKEIETTYKVISNELNKS